MLQLFSEILKYPNGNLKKNTISLIKRIDASLDKKSASEINDYLKVFFYYLEKTGLKEQEEIFTQTFEVQSITTMDIGYILFGDDYKRAELLVNLNNEMNKYGVNCGNELADYLPNVLSLLDVLEDDLLKEELINHLVYPAIKRIIADFDSKVFEQKCKIYLKHQKALIEKSKEFRDIYVNILIALKLFLEKKFNAKEVIIESKHNGFLSSIEEELNIEKLS
jgi:nitrate reductase assembly molybdenum cofactor insertion protein NarJ